MVDVVDVPHADASDALDVDATDAHGADVTDAIADAGAPCTSDLDCVPQFCGCGACDPSQITCGTTATQNCMLGCPIGPCPALENVRCACVSSGDGMHHCAVASLQGPGRQGDSCNASTQCMTGLLCCYPCGVPGCNTMCSVPDTATGECPQPL